MENSHGIQSVGQIVPRISHNLLMLTIEHLVHSAVLITAFGICVKAGSYK